MGANASHDNVVGVVVVVVGDVVVVVVVVSAGVATSLRYKRSVCFKYQ